MKKLAFIFLFACSSVFANDWLVASKNPEITFSIKLSTLTVSKHGNPEAIIRGQSTKNKQLTFEFASITKSDCENGYGSLLFYDTQRVYKYKVEYVKDGGTNASNIADLLCEFIAHKNSV